jgi:hypothetical protein
MARVERQKSLMSSSSPLMNRAACTNSCIAFAFLDQKIPYLVPFLEDGSFVDYTVPIRVYHLLLAVHSY